MSGHRGGMAHEDDEAPERGGDHSGSNLAGKLGGGLEVDKKPFVDGEVLAPELCPKLGVGDVRWGQWRVSRESSDDETQVPLSLLDVAPLGCTWERDRVRVPDDGWEGWGVGSCGRLGKGGQAVLHDGCAEGIEEDTQAVFAGRAQEARRFGVIEWHDVLGKSELRLLHGPRQTKHAPNFSWANWSAVQGFSLAVIAPNQEWGLGDRRGLDLCKRGRGALDAEDWERVKGPVSRVGDAGSVRRRAHELGQSRRVRGLHHRRNIGVQKPEVAWGGSGPL